MQVSAAVRVMPVPAVSIWPMKTVVFRVGLELLDDVSAILLFDVAVDGHGFHSSGAERLFAQGFDFVNLRDEPGEDHQFLLALDHVVLEVSSRASSFPRLTSFGWMASSSTRKPPVNCCRRRSFVRTVVAVMVPPSASSA